MFVMEYDLPAFIVTHVSESNQSLAWGLAFKVHLHLCVATGNLLTLSKPPLPYWFPRLQNEDIATALVKCYKIKRAPEVNWPLKQALFIELWANWVQIYF